MTPETSQTNAESSAMAVGRITLYATLEQVTCTINGQPVDTSRVTPISWAENPIQNRQRRRHRGSCWPQWRDVL